MSSRGGGTFSVNSRLTALELKLVRALEAEDSFRFTPSDLKGAGAYIRAGLVRAILTGMEIRVPRPAKGGSPDAASGLRPIRLRGSGLRVRPAEVPRTEPEVRALTRLPIRGSLDLTHSRAEGGAPLPPLELSYCRFDDVIDLSDASMGPVSLDGSLFDMLVSRHATFDGSLSLRWCGSAGSTYAEQCSHFPFKGDLDAGRVLADAPITPLPADHRLATCVLTLRSSSIAGSLDLSFSDFCRTPEQLNPGYGMALTAAVNLGSCTVRESILLDQTVVIGGIDFRGAEVGESVWLSGARIFGYGFGSGSAINAQLTTVGAVFAISSTSYDVRPGFGEAVVIGSTFGLGIKAREIWMWGVLVGDIRLAKACVELGVTLGAYAGESYPSQFGGVLTLNDAIIGGNLELRALDKPHCTLAEGLSAEMRHPFYVERLSCGVRVFLAGLSAADARVSGSVIVQNAKLFAMPASQILPLLVFQRARIGGDVELNSSIFEGGLVLRGARVEGGLRLADCVIDLRATEDGAPAAADTLQQRVALNLRDCSCGRELEVSRLQWRRYTRIGAEDAMYRIGFYRDCAIVEQLDHAGRYTRIVCDLLGLFQPMLIDGSSAYIHELNQTTNRLDLSTDEKRRDYLCFFTDAIGGQEGAFKIVEAIDIADIAFTPLREIERPATADGAPAWRYEATVMYGNALFRAEFDLSPSGRVQMPVDNAIASDLPIARPDRFPRRTPWQMVEPRIRPRSYLGEPLGADDRAKIATNDTHPTESGTEPGRWPRRLAAWAKDFMPQRLDLANDADPSAAIVDLQGLDCAALIDSFGAGWGFPDDLNDRPRIWLNAAGVRCQRVQPSAHGRSVSGGPFASGAMSRQFGAAGTSTIDQDAPDRRIAWLSHQFSRRPRSDSWPPISWWSRLFGRSAARWADAESFVPQTYDEFATAHYRAGEPLDGQKILVEKKDIQSVIAFKTGLRARFSPERPLALAATVAMIATGLGGLLWWTLWTRGFEDTAPLMLVPALGGVLLLYTLWPFLQLFGQVAFKLGFRYGLSPNRALATCAVMLLLGWGATHYARTGSFAGTPAWENYISRGEKLPEEIALVLAVDFAAGDEARPTPARGDPTPLRLEGRAIYAAPTPCNVGVSSLLYATDVFIPLLDLDQEPRCAIRASPDSETFDRYRGWRMAKALYEIVGWIVISLTILTISGVMRRDIER